MSLPAWSLPVGALLLGLGLGGAAAWKWQANSYQLDLEKQAGRFQQERLDAALAIVDWNETATAQRQALEARLRASDAMHTQELQDAQKTQARLRDRLATADLRLSVLLASSDATGGSGMPAANGAGVVVHATTRAQLDPAHAQRIVGITDDGDQGLIALQACQAYVREIAQ